MKKQTSYTGYLLALSATMIWSGNFIVARDLKDLIPPATLSLLRWATAAIVLFPFAWKALKNDWHLIRKQLWLLIPVSFLGVSLFNVLLYKAAQTSPVVNMSLIAITSPLFIALLNRIIFKERFDALKITGFIVVMAGLVILITKGDLAGLLQLEFSAGDILMATGAFLFAGYSVLLKKKNPAIGRMALLLFTFLTGALLLVPLALVEQSIEHTVIPFSWGLLGQIAYVGVCASLLSYFCWNSAIDRIGSTNTAAVYNLLPVFSTLAAVVFLGEQLPRIQVLSGIIILVGLFLIIKVRKPSRSPLPAGSSHQK